MNVHSDVFGILHFPYYVLAHTKSFSGILNSVGVWVLNVGSTYGDSELAYQVYRSGTGHTNKAVINDR